MLYTIQNSVFPKIGLCTEAELYFRLNEYVDLNIHDARFTLEPRGKIGADTYFNSISVGKLKRHTTIEDLQFAIRFRGRIKISWKLHRLHFTTTILDETYLTHEEEREVALPLAFWNTLEDGMLFFEIEALGISEITDFRFMSTTAPQHSIKLGIVITHFNRQQYVLPALRRLQQELLELPEYGAQISLSVVDNSNNLVLPEDMPATGIRIIPNRNLGGAGGFTRGLMELEDAGDYTHCLFMDDDASGDVEGIKRTLMLLQYARDPALCVAGAMLHEAEPYRQHENGARFKGHYQGLKSGLDLREVDNLLFNELEEKIDYGGWWFFAFPLAEVKHYAFPYFVRGDDVGFGLAHQFHTITLNGISSWQGDFALKQGPVPAYLDTRYHLMQYFHGFVDDRISTLLRITAIMAARNLLTYHYDTALASIMAMEDVCKGDDYWRNNMDMSERRKTIGALAAAEKMQDIPLDVYMQASPEGQPGGKWRRLASRLTLNGHLLPQCFFHKGYVRQFKGWGGRLQETFRFRKVLYVHAPTHRGFFLQHDKRKFFAYLWRYCKAVWQLLAQRQQLQQMYRKSYAEFTSRDFWKAQFDEGKK